jgi:hypothetical protein
MMDIEEPMEVWGLGTCEDEDIGMVLLIGS